MRPERAGFSLLEILIAVVIFAIGVIAVLGALNTGIFSGTDVEDTNLAVNIAQAKMEDLVNTAFSSIASASAAPDPDFTRFTVTTSVTTVVSNYLKQIVVIVAWNTVGGQVNVTLTTLRASG